LSTSLSSGDIDSPSIEDIYADTFATGDVSSDVLPSSPEVTVSSIIDD